MRHKLATIAAAALAAGMLGAPSYAGDYDDGKHKVTICHATGSASNPYVKLSLSKQGAENHLKNHDDDYKLKYPKKECKKKDGKSY